MILLTKNKNCHLDSQMQQFNIKEVYHPSHPRKPGYSQAAYKQLIQLNSAVHC